MNELEKFFRKLSAQERTKLLKLIDDVLSDPGSFGGKKLTGSQSYRAKKGRYRFIYFYDKNGNIQLETVRFRDEKTYRDV
jgi:mRNA-degrading endonuclease RelE of RelBE toxin-antitoxin system